MSARISRCSRISQAEAGESVSFMLAATDGEKCKPLDLAQLPSYVSPVRPLEQRDCAAGAQAAGRSAHV